MHDIFVVFAPLPFRGLVCLEKSTQILFHLPPSNPQMFCFFILSISICALDIIEDMLSIGMHAEYAHFIGLMRFHLMVQFVDEDLVNGSLGGSANEIAVEIGEKGISIRDNASDVR